MPSYRLVWQRAGWISNGQSRPALSGSNHARSGVDLNHFGGAYGEGTRKVVLNEPSRIVGAEEDTAASDAKLVELCLGGLGYIVRNPDSVKDATTCGAE